jgi:CheY-like chemotaxis protein
MGNEIYNGAESDTQSDQKSEYCKQRTKRSSVNATQILVIDNNSSICDVLSAQLSQNRYTVTQACDELKAWELFQKERYDVVVTNLQMSHLNDALLIARIKERSPMTVIIMVTSNGTLQSIITVIKSGCDEYLLKPFRETHEIELVVQHALKRQPIMLSTVLQNHIRLAKRKILHDLADDRVEPVFDLLSDIDILVNKINRKNCHRVLSIANRLKKKYLRIYEVVGKPANDPTQLLRFRLVSG